VNKNGALFFDTTTEYMQRAERTDVALPPSQVSVNPASANPTEFKKQVFQQARILICICFQSKALIGVTFASR